MSAKSKALYEMYTSFEAFYNAYLKFIEQYESLDDMPYPQRERLIKLCNIYHQADLSYRKSIRNIYNFDKIVFDEEMDFILSFKRLINEQ